MATGKVPYGSIVPNRDRAHHGNAAERNEQSEVEGMHASVSVCLTVRKLNARDRVGYLRDSEEGGSCIAEQSLERPFVAG